VFFLATFGSGTVLNLPPERNFLECSGPISVRDDAIADEVYTAVGLFASQTGLTVPTEGRGVEFRLEPDRLELWELGRTTYYKSEYGRRCVVIVRHDGDLDTVLHEYGHVLGYAHSKTGLMRP